MHGRHPLRSLLAALLTLAAVLALPAVASAAQKVITSIGPLTNIYVNDNLGCQFTHTGDTHPEFFGGTDPGSCGTQVKVSGVDGTFGNGAGPSLTPVSQTDVGGTGTAANPFRVLTITDVGTTGVRLAQVDSYVVGQEAYRTSVTVTNTGNALVGGVLYHGADCYLGDDDHGYGFHDAVTGGIYCTKQPDNEPAGRLEGFVPLTAGSTYYEGFYSSNYAQIQSGLPLPNTCDCAVNEDNGASIAWTYGLGAGQSRTFQFATTSSPAGIVPDTTPPAVTLDQPASGSTIPDATPTLSGHAGTAAGDQAEITIGVYAGGTASGTPVQTLHASASGGTWSATAASPLAEGLYTAVATQSDDAGNVGTSPAHTFTVGPTDAEAPRVSLVDPGKGAHTTDKTPDFNGVGGTDPGDFSRVSVEVHSGDSTSGPVALSLVAILGGGGAWHVSPAAADALRPGSYTAQAVQADTAGNVGRSKAHRFTIDPVAGDFANLEVSVTQSAPPILVGRDLTFSVHVRNRGPGVATDVTLTDMLPEGAALPDTEARAVGSAACSRSGRQMTCTVGSLAAGHSADFDFVVVPRRSGVMANTASVAGTSIDTVTASNTGQARPTVVRAPKIGKTVDAAVVRGKVRYRKRGTKRVHVLRGQVELPVGSLVNATHGRVRLTAERKAGGQLQTADFYRGKFLLRQRRAGGGLTTLDLRGGSFKGCPKTARSRHGATVARKRRHRHRRRLWGSGHGRFRTRGRFGSATVRGTVWYTQDACRATYFKTRRGVVNVRNYVKKKTVKVRAGHSYYARAPRP